MKIHNLYSDFLQSLGNYLSDKVLNFAEIKGIEYNIGNVTFQTEAKANISLPRMVINFNDSNLIRVRGTTYQYYHSDINQYVVMYNRSKGLEFSLQEDLYRMDLNVLINTDNQMSALSIKHKLENYMPVGKPLNFYEFWSFIEIDDELINNNFINPDTDDITNIYFKFDEITGKSKYCFPIYFKPLITVNSISLDFSDNNSRSFTVDLSIEIQTPFPSKMICPRSNNYRPDEEKTRIMELNDVFIPLSDEYNFYKLYFNTNEDIIYMDKNSNSYTNSEYTLSFERNVLHYYSSFTGEYDGNIINTYGYIIKNLEKDKFISVNFISGNLHGKMYNVNEENSFSISGYFDGFIGKNRIKKKLILNYEVDKIKEKLDNVIVDNKVLLKYERLDSNDIYNVIGKNINTFQTTIDLKILSYKLTDGSEIILDEPVLSDVFGNINLGNSITLTLNRKTGEFVKGDNRILSLNADIILTFNSNWGSGYVSEIVLDFAVNTDVISYAINKTKNFSNSIITSKIKSTFNEDTKEYTVYLKLNKPTISRKWNIILSNPSIYFSYNKKDIEYDEENSDDLNFLFKMNEYTYITYFSKINNIYPLILSIE